MEGNKNIVFNKMQKFCTLILFDIALIAVSLLDDNVATLSSDNLTAIKTISK